MVLASRTETGTWRELALVAFCRVAWSVSAQAWAVGLLVCSALGEP